MSEKPLERLNYFNGQRLQAGDLRLEQDYHMRVRRWLNRSLYTAGIAAGLEVYPVPGAPKVRVQPGLAIDPLGREIILLESRDVPVMHDIGQGERFDGSYLVIRYHEQVTAQQDANCAGTNGCADKAAAGGPSRVLSDPVLECVPDLPHEGSGKILLGRIVMADGCASIAYIDTSLRRYIGQASQMTVRRYALEGCREIDVDNPATIRFHVRGRQPNAVTLYLRSERFPTYYYSELGRHSHGSNVSGGASTGPASNIDSHAHGAGTLKAKNDDNHNHSLSGWVSTFKINLLTDLADPLALVNYLVDPILPAGTQGASVPGSPAPQFDTGTPQYMLRALPTIGTRGPGGQSVPHLENLKGTKFGMVLGSGSHSHSVEGQSGGTQSTLNAAQLHTHAFSASINASGVDSPARTGMPLTYVEDLQVFVDGTDVSARLRQQLSHARPRGEDWSRLGNGKGDTTDVLHTVGTGEIKLDYLVPLGEGEHRIDLKVLGRKADGGPNGGRILYNLYVE